MHSNRTNLCPCPNQPQHTPGSQAPSKVTAIRRRLLPGRGAVLVLVACVGVVAAGLAPSQGEKSDAPEKIDAAAFARMVQNFDKVEKQEHPWGWIRWLMNDKFDPKSEMTFGLVEINAGQRNPLHVHPNCEELLYVLSGSCEHVLGKQKWILKAGDVIRIPAGVPHFARTFDKEGMKAVIVYSSGDRQFQIVEE